MYGEGTRGCAPINKKSSTDGTMVVIQRQICTLPQGNLGFLVCLI